MKGLAPVDDTLDATPANIERLLRESRDAHLEYMRSARIGPHRIAAVRAIIKALRLRSEAERLDPQRKTQAWDIERETKFDHDQIIRFYLGYLTRHDEQRSAIEAETP